MENKSSEFFSELFKSVGEEPTREGLCGTPKRFLESFNFLCSGYFQNPKDTLGSLFSDGVCDEMIVIKDIEFYSVCEHHLLPFFGKISVGYIPDKNVVGISNIAKLVEVFSRRLQIQENLTMQIADTLMEILAPKGVMVVCNALHLCMAMRGVQKQSASVTTSAVRGLFKKDSRTRDEFMQLIKA